MFVDLGVNLNGVDLDVDHQCTVEDKVQGGVHVQVQVDVNVNGWITITRSKR